MGVRFLRAVRGRPVFKEDQGPDEFIASLDLIDKAQFQLRKVTGRFHAGSPLDASTPCPARETHSGGGLPRPAQGPQAVSAPPDTVGRVCRTSVWC